MWKHLELFKAICEYEFWIGAFAPVLNEASQGRARVCLYKLNNEIWKASSKSPAVTD